MNEPILPDEGHYYVALHPDDWPEAGVEWAQPIEAYSPTDAVQEWARAKDREGGFSGDPYPNAWLVMVRDHAGKEWTVRLDTEWEPTFWAYLEEDAA